MNFDMVLSGVEDNYKGTNRAGEKILIKHLYILQEVSTSLCLPFYDYFAEWEMGV